MKIISEAVGPLWQAKARRQVIFTSHNPNLVVNGDAELVICCDYRTSATQLVSTLHFARLQPGTSVEVRYDPANPMRVALVL